MTLGEVPIGTCFRFKHANGRGEVTHRTSSGTYALLEGELAIHVYSSGAEVEVIPPLDRPVRKERKRVEFERAESCGAVEKGRYKGVRKPKCWHGRGCPRCIAAYRARRTS